MKDKRPAISPNLNFMGQLVQFEKELVNNPDNTHKLDIDGYLPSSAQMELSEMIRLSTFGTGSGGSSANSTPEPRSAGGNIGSASVEASGQPFLLKMPKPRRRQKQQLKFGVGNPEQPNNCTKKQNDDAQASYHNCASSQEAHVSDFPVSPSTDDKSSTLSPSVYSPTSSASSVVKDIVRKFEKPGC